MKLKRPRVDSYTAPDGSASLTYVGLDHSHDMGGSDYRFIYRDDGREVAIGVRVQPILRANQAARERGIDLWSLTLEEAETFKSSYYEMNPRDYQVIRFVPEVSGTDFDVRGAADTFCQLFLELVASFRFNDPAYPEMGDGHYWERVFFQPYDLDSRLHFDQSSARS